MGRHRHREDADGRGGRHHDARQGDARRRASASIKQGPVAIELAFEGGKATGTMAMGGEPKPVSVDLGGDAVRRRRGRRRGARRAAARRGLQHDLPQLRRAEAEGAAEAGEGDRAPRSVTVPAGTFKAWKVEITSAEGEPGSTTIWVAKDSRKVVKTTATLPADGRRRGDDRAAAVGPAVIPSPCHSEGLRSDGSRGIRRLSAGAGLRIPLASRGRLGFLRPARGPRVQGQPPATGDRPPGPPSRCPLGMTGHAPESGPTASGTRGPGNEVLRGRPCGRSAAGPAS